MRLHFDPEQPHQREVIDAVVASLACLGAAPRGGPGPDGVIRNPGPLDPQRLLADLRRVQAQAGLPVSSGYEGAELTVEMETGTGKTYAYLRCMRELHARYGVSRFIVVVPGVAIRCGVLSQIELLADHLGALYPGQRVEAAVFDPQRLSAVRRFARDEGLQILVMNIDAFNKGRGNLGHRPADALRGDTPVELCAATRPVVVLDEPQSMEGPRARAALAELGALVTLRWSATHRRAPHRVHRLDPVRASELGLVKRIDVAAVTAEGGAGAVTLLETRSSRRGVSARLAIEGAAGRQVLTVRGEGEDLHALSGGVEACRGVVVEAVDHGAETVRLSSGAVLRVGADGAAREAVWRRQLEETVACHLERELACRELLPAGERMKVLSLVFIDRVDDYAPPGAPVRRLFAEAWLEAARSPRYESLRLPAAEQVQASYFARRRGVAADSTGRSREDDEAYALIMKDKARLISPDEPVRFIFSHSALREGWDNPNVFQICTLHRTRSELRKRQELGRGLRLPVLESGRRSRDPDIARLTVIANESYERFARELQREVSEECGVDFAPCIGDRRERWALGLRDGWRGDPWFGALWQRAARPLRFVPGVDGESLRARAAERLAAIGPARAPAVRTERATFEAGELVATGATRSSLDAREAAASVPDPVAWLQAETGLGRATLAALLGEPGVLGALLGAPSAWLEAAAAALGALVAEQCATHGRYQVVGPSPDLEVLAHRPLLARGRSTQPVARSIHPALPVRDEAERAWLEALDAAPDTRTIWPWPSWLRVPSPGPAVSPRWLVARERADGTPELVLVAREPGDRLGRRLLGELASALELTLATPGSLRPLDP
ncbi:MAG: DEAD/DEAH box helicase family protein [Deltaproteobacteria bacterium]|nr:DEAD/DEAH box helicase family protein [Deltaproteobacteria bacterium]